MQVFRAKMRRMEIPIGLLLVIYSVSSERCQDSVVKEDCSVGVVGHVDYCKTDVNYCMNQGFCYNLGGESLCRCSGDFEGQRCQWRPCPPSPNNQCDKGGLCYWRPGMYPVRKICRCLSNSGGRYCNDDEFGPAQIQTTTTTATETAAEIKESTMTTSSQMVQSRSTTSRAKDAADLCEVACENGGKCSEDGRRCDCPICCSGQRCEICRDPCEGVSCNNGGRCSVDSHCRAHCDCSATGFIGHDCKYKRTCDPCDEKPCLNQGECTVKEGRYDCTCRSGWSGQRCQWRTPPHDCWQDCEREGQVCAKLGTSWSCVPLWESKCHGLDNCFKESVCTNHYGRFECLCRKNGYKGVSCVEAPNVCDAAVNPCLYGGTCEPTGGLNGTYICRCPPHLSRPHCDVCDACEPNPCQNGGRCQPFGEVTQLNFKCLCSGRQRGRFCQMSQNPCNTHKCFHSKFGGKCRVNEFDEPICECPSSFVGAHCEAEDMCARRPCDSFGTERCRPLVEQNYFECVCLPGFQGYACQYADEQVGSDKFCADFLPCGRERGACKVEDGRLNCECGRPNMGLNCERNNCSLGRNPCVRGGCQLTKKGTPFCNCSANGRRHTDAMFGGPRCNKFKGLTACSTSLCRGRGRCVWPASGFGLVVCACDQGYVGENCDLETTTVASTIRKVADPCEIAEALKKCRNARCERLSDSVAICQPVVRKGYNFTAQALVCKREDQNVQLEKYSCFQKKCVDVHCFGRKECLYYPRIGKAVCLEVPGSEVRQPATSATSTLSTTTTSALASTTVTSPTSTPNASATSTSTATASTNWTSTSMANASDTNATSTATTSTNSTSTSASSTTTSTTSSSSAATTSASSTSTLTTSTSASRRRPTPTAATNITSIAGVGVVKATTPSITKSTSVAAPTPTTRRGGTTGVGLATTVTTTEEVEQQIASGSSRVSWIVAAGIVGGAALVCLLCLVCVCLLFCWRRRRRRRVHDVAVKQQQQQDKAERREEVGQKIRRLSEEKTAAEKATTGAGDETAPPAKSWNELARTSDGEEVLPSPVETSVSLGSVSQEQPAPALLPEEPTESSEEDSESESESSSSSESLEVGDNEPDLSAAVERTVSSMNEFQEEGDPTSPASTPSSSGLDTESTQSAGRRGTRRLESEPLTKAGLVLLFADKRPPNSQSSPENRKTLTIDVPDENVGKRLTEILNAVDEHEGLAPPSPRKISTTQLLPPTSAQLRQLQENSKDRQVVTTNERDIEMVNSKVMLAPIGSSDDEEDLETPPPSPKQEENEQPQPKQEQIISIEFGGSDQ